MKIISTFRRLLPVVAVSVLVALTVASCGSSNKRYGCPNKLESLSFSLK